MNQNHKTLLDRLNRLPAHSKTAEVRSAAESTLTIVDSFRTHSKETAASGKFSEAGARGVVRDRLSPALRKLQIAMKPIADSRREIEAKRATLRPADPDPTNLFAAIQHMEIHAHLRSLKPLERDALLLTTADLRLLEAAIGAPPELSGCTDRNLVEQVEGRYAALKYPAEVAELNALETLVQEAEAIVQVARNDLRDVVQMDAREFEAETRKVEGAVWIVGASGAEQVCEPDANGQATYRPATPEEVVTGRSYSSAAEFMAARAA